MGPQLTLNDACSVARPAAVAQLFQASLKDGCSKMKDESGGLRDCLCADFKQAEAIAAKVRVSPSKTHTIRVPRNKYNVVQRLDAKVRLLPPSALM